MLLYYILKKKFRVELKVLNLQKFKSHCYCCSALFTKFVIFNPQIPCIYLFKTFIVLILLNMIIV